MAAQRGYGKHLLLKAGIWYFRLALPADIRNRSGKKEVRLSLGTGYARIAATYAISLDASKHKLFSTIRSDIMADLTADKIKEYIAAHFRKTLESMWDTMLDSPHSSTEELEKTIDKVNQFKNQAKTNLALRNTGPSINAVDEIITTNGLDTIKDSRDYTRLGVEVLKAYVDVAEVLLLRLKGNHRDEESILAAYSTSHIRDSSYVKNKEINLLFGLIDAYCADKISSKRWKNRGVDENHKKFARIKLILGNIPVSSIDYSHVSTVRETLQKIPARMNIKEYAGMNLEELVALKDVARLSKKTINDELHLASSLFAFAIKNRVTSINPFQGSALAKDSAPEETRLAFTAEDIKKIFEQDAYSQHCGNDPSRHWLPLLGLFTGARLAELCQLTVSDVYLLGDLLVIDINDNAHDKNLKTPGSKRLIPVHPTLRDTLGFERFVSQAKEAGQERLFPNLKYTRKRYSHKPSQDFGRYLKSLGGFEKKCFHSFRHGLVMNLRNQGISNEIIASVTGHKDTGPIPDNYKKKHDPHFLMENAISKLTFTVAPPL